MSIQRDIKKIEIPVYDLRVPVSQNNTFPIQFRIVTEDGSKTSAWSNIFDISSEAVDGGDTLTLKNKSTKINASWEDDNNRVLYDIFAYKFSNIDLTTFGTSRKSRPTTTTGQITTYATDTVSDTNKLPHNLKVGMRIALSNFGTNFDIADTYVTQVIDPYTFVYSPVPNTTLLGESTDTDGLIEIFGTTSAGYTMDIDDYQFIGRTDKNTFSISKTITKKSLGGTSYTSTATDMWCLIQVASANRKPSSAIDIATAYIAV